MLNQDFIQNLSRKVAELFPVASAAQRDIEGRISELLQSSFSRLNLVTREEFDAQLAVLERAHRTITELELRVAELERQVQTPADRSALAGTTAAQEPPGQDS